MDSGQQVFVTGADGEQMVLSGPEAAALLAQAGINLGDQEQVMIGGDQGDQGGGAAEQPAPAEGEEGVGNIMVPEGSSVGEDGSIIAADGSILAPPGTVLIGEDGTLMMAENSSLLGNQEAVPEDGTAVAGADAAAGAVLDGGGTVFQTPDGATFKAGEGDILTDADGNVLTDEDGNVLTTAHLGALGAASAAPTITTSAPTMTTSDGAMITSDGAFLRTADGNLLTDEEGNFIAADGNIMKPEDAHKLLEAANQEAVFDETSTASATPDNVENIENAQNVQAGESIEEIAAAVSNQTVSEVAAVVEPEKKEAAASEVTDMSMDSEPPQLEVRSKTAIETDNAAALISEQVTDNENNAVNIEPEKSKTEVAPVSEEIAPTVSASESVLPDQENDVINSMPIMETDDGNNTAADGSAVSNTAANNTIDNAIAVASTTSVPSVNTTISAAEMSAVSAVSSVINEPSDILSTAVTAVAASSDAAIVTNSVPADPAVSAAVSMSEVAVSIPSSSFVTTDLVSNLSLPSINTSADGGIYTTADGRVLSLPEGIMANTSGHLINPADGSILTTEDGTPLMLPEGAILQPAVASTTSGIMVSESANIPVSSSNPATSLFNNQAQPLSADPGTMIAPEGSIVASDGSILAADGTMLAPPGSVSLTPDPPQPLPQQPVAQNPPIPAHQLPTEPLAPAPSQNLIGLQLPESGEVLYLDPADPAAQQLLSEAGIHLGDGGVLQTLDGQVLAGEDGNPITTGANNKTQTSPSKHNSIVNNALAAAGLVDTTDIDIPISANMSPAPTLTPNLPTQPVSYTQLAANNDDVIRQHLSQLQPRYTPPGQTQVKQTKQSNTAGTQYKKLTFNSGAAGASYASPAPAPIPKRSIAPKQRRTVPNTDLQIGPDQQKVTYTVTSENGYTQTYMMICSKSLDQNTLINTLIKNISSDPNHKGKKTIKITQHKYGAKKTTKQQPQQRAYNGPQQRQVLSSNTVGGGQQMRQVQQRLAPAPAPQQRIVQQVLSKPVQQTVQSASPSTLSNKQSPMKPPQQLLETEQDIPGDFSNNLSLDDIMKQVTGSDNSQGQETESKDPKVMVRCHYCTNFRCVLNSQTWENILNHILPVAKEELHCSFYGNILKHFARGLKVSVTGGRDQCEVVVSHGLVCRRTGSWYSVDKPGVELATTLASHIAAVQPGATGPYGARPRGNSLICLFCNSPYTPEDYQRHLKPHEDFIKPCLLLAAGAYCATSFELEVRKMDQDLRFLPCTKFSPEFNCTKKLQATVDCFRENFDSRGFLQVSNSAMTKCSICRTPNNTYCALFKPNAATARIFGGNSEEMLSVCATCQKQFVNVVMRENSFEKQLKMFQLHHMEQLCGMLRVLLSASPAVASRSYNLLYTVQEGGSLYSASNTLHTVSPAKIVMNPMTKQSKLEEDKSQELTGPSLKYCCEQCKFSIDLTRLCMVSGAGKSGGLANNSHLVDMAVGVVLEHIVPHTESLMSVIMTSAFNEVFRLKFEFTATVEGEGLNKKIVIGLDRKIVGVETGVEVNTQKDVQKTVELLKSKLKQDKKGNVTIKKKHLFTDNSNIGDGDTGTMMEIGKFLEAATNVLQLYGSCGCNTKLLDYYAECRLCGKFSFPDFRLTAAIKSTTPVALCENCCETILSLCVPSEPERVRGETCLLLGAGAGDGAGHRLVLSNNTKKWISADAVEKIQAVSEIANNATIPDYSTTLVGLLKSHLTAVSERAWSDTSCMTARAGFCVTSDNKQSPIEVKVTIRPPKPKTPPTSKLVITPVNVKPSPGTGNSSNTRLVKITANRRIIPVRDPTSISTPPNKTKITALSHPNNKTGSTKITPKLPPNTSITKSDPKEEEIDSDLEKEDDFESIDAIANFISSSEPPVKKVKSEEKASNEVCDVLTDEFTDTALSTSHNNGTPDSLTKLPSGTVVSNVEKKTESDEDRPSTAPHNNINGDANGEEEEDDIKLPPGLVISPASGPGLTKIQGEAKVVEVGSKGDSALSTKVEAVEADNVIELGSPKTEIVPSLASDATTSTKDTVTPSKAALVTSKGKKPHMPRLVPRQEADKDGEKSQKDEKTSTVKMTRKVETDTAVVNSNNSKTRQSKRDSDNDEESSLTSLDVDIDNEDLEEDDENNEIGVNMKRVSVKLSAILPKPTKSRNSTPASSSRKGMPSKPVSKPGDKRKRTEEPSAALKQSKKAKLSEDEEAPGTPETGGAAELLSGTSSSGRVRRVKKIFDL